MREKTSVGGKEVTKMFFHEIIFVFRVYRVQTGGKML